MAPAETPDQAAQKLLQLAKERFGDLNEAEAKILRAAPRGDGTYCGPSSELDDPSNDPAKADEWGPERQVRAGLIRWLCVDPAAANRVDPIGLRLVGARITGTLKLASVSAPFPLWLLHCRLADRVLLMSTQIPALYLNGSRTGPIQAGGLSVKSDLHLRDGFTAEGEVWLHGAQFGGNLDCSGGRFKNPPQKDSPESGKALIADGANVKGSVFLSNGFTAEGEVRLPGAQIGARFSCTGGTFKNPPQMDVAGSGTALNADAVEVRGEILLNKGFRAEGEVRLLGAQTSGNLNFSGGSIKNPPHKDVAGGGKALSADGANVKGSVFLSNGFTAEGQVRLLGARIGGNIECSGGTFKNPTGENAGWSCPALIADGANVKGSVFLSNGFTAEGAVWLLGAQIGGDLNCSDGTFSMLSAQGTRVSHHLFLSELQAPKSGTFDLTNASADALLDNEESWPAAGNLYLDGFVYGRISEGPIDADTRLKWLALQPEFKPQPYRQLAKVLRESGDDRGARRILYEMEKLRQKEQSRIWRDRLHVVNLSRRNRPTGWTRYGLARVWGLVLKATIGYGFGLQRTLYWLIGLTLVGTLLFGLGYLGGSMAPTEREAYASFEKEGWPPRHYQAFNPFIYALENSVPMLKLGQDSAWAPDPGPRDSERMGAVNFRPWKWVARVSGNYLPAWVMPPPWLLRGFRWLQIVMGWMLATLFVAGVTGVVRRE